MTKKVIKLEDFAENILFSASFIDHPIQRLTASEVISARKNAIITNLSLETIFIFGWTGGDKPPVPDGVKLRIFTASSACGGNQPNRHHEDGYINNWMNIVLDGVSIITAFQVLGIDEDYVLEGME